MAGSTNMSILLDGIPELPAQGDGVLASELKKTHGLIELKIKLDARGGVGLYNERHDGRDGIEKLLRGAQKCIGSIIKEAGVKIVLRRGIGLSKL